MAYSDSQTSTTADIFTARVEVSDTGVVDWMRVRAAGLSDAATSANTEIMPSLDYPSGVGYGLVAWWSGGSIRARKISSQGWANGSSFELSATGPTAAPISFPVSVSYSLAGDVALVAWEDTRNGDSDIYASLLSNFGAILWSGKIHQTVSTRQYHPSVIPMNSGKFLISFNDNNTSIYSSVFDTSAATDSDPLTDPVSAAVQVFSDSSISYLNSAFDPSYDNGNGQVMLVFNHGSGVDVSGVQLDSNLNVLRTISICSAADGQPNPSVVFNPHTQNYLVAWTDRRNYTTNGGDAYVVTVDDAGTVHATEKNITPSCDGHNGEQNNVKVAYNAEKQMYFSVWNDDRIRSPKTPGVSAQWMIFGQALQ